MEPDSNLLKTIQLKRFMNLSRNHLQPINIPYDNKSALGSGINASGQIFASSIEHQGDSVESNNPKVEQICWKSITKEENDRELKTVAELPVTGPCLEVSGDLSYLSNMIPKGNSINFHIIHSFEGSHKLMLKEPRLTPKAEEKLKNDGILEFVKDYGTHFIAGFIYAACFHGEITINTENKDVQKIAVEAQGLITSIASKLNMQLSYEVDGKCLSEKYLMNCKCSIRGITKNQIVMMMPIGQLWDTYKNFIEKVNSKDNPTSPFLMICKPWISLDQVLKMPEMNYQYNKLEEFVNREVEFRVFLEIQKYLSILKFKEAASLLLMAQTLHDIKIFVDSMAEDKVKAQLLEGLAQALLDEPDPRGKKLAEFYLKKQMNPLEHSKLKTSGLPDQQPKFISSEEELFSPENIGAEIEIINTEYTNKYGCTGEAKLFVCNYYEGFFNFHVFCGNTDNSGRDRWFVEKSGNGLKFINKMHSNHFGCNGNAKLLVTNHFQAQRGANFYVYCGSSDTDDRTYFRLKAKGGEEFEFINIPHSYNHGCNDEA